MNLSPCLSTGIALEIRFLALILYALHISQLTQFHMASSMERNQGRKSVEPPSGLEPCRAPAWPKMARSLEMARSQAIPISWPPATLMPFTRQITGFLQLRIASTMPLNRSMYSPYSWGRME